MVKYIPLLGMFFLWAVLFGSEKCAKETLSVPDNVFADDQVNPRVIWWRPYKVVFDPIKALSIQQKLDSITTEQASVIPLEELETDGTSAFLFPILAANQAKGVCLLGRFLQEYQQKNISLDNRWLLIVASLGRCPEKEAEMLLRQEMDRIFPLVKRYVKIKNVDGTILQVPKPTDERYPLADALLANLAVRNQLNCTDLLELEKRFEKDPFGERICWLDGLQWAHRYQGIEAVGKLSLDGLSASTDQQLYEATNMQSPNPRVFLINDYLLTLAETDLSQPPLMQEILLGKYGPVKDSVKDFLLVHYGRLLILQAKTKNGLYKLDERIANLYRRREHLIQRKLFSYYAEILKACISESADPDWQKYLEEAAMNIDQKWKKSAANEVEEIYKHETSSAQSIQKSNSRRDYPPGVYMVGFRMSMNL